MDYYKNKLKEKVNIIFNSKGIKNDLEIKDSLFKGVTLGKYEIVWDIINDNILSLIKIDKEVKVFNGLYYFGSKTLHSSQFIEFNIQEEREFKLNKVLNINDNLYICKNYDKMNKLLTEEEKKKRQHLKELKSLRNKMTGSKLIWFDSLSEKKKWDLLFEWKLEKYNNKLEKPEVRYIKRRVFGKVVKQKNIDYPSSLKHFTKSKIGRGKWRIDKSEYRNTAIDILLNNK